MGREKRSVTVIICWKHIGSGGCHEEGGRRCVSTITPNLLSGLTPTKKGSKLTKITIFKITQKKKTLGANLCMSKREILALTTSPRKPVPATGLIDFQNENMFSKKGMVHHSFF